MVIEVGRIFQADVPRSRTLAQIEKFVKQIAELPGVASTEWTPIWTILVESYQDTEVGYEELKRKISKIIK